MQFTPNVPKSCVEDSSVKDNYCCIVLAKNAIILRKNFGVIMQ